MEPGQRAAFGIRLARARAFRTLMTDEETQARRLRESARSEFDHQATLAQNRVDSDGAIGGFWREAAAAIADFVARARPYPSLARQLGDAVARLRAGADCDCLRNGTRARCRSPACIAGLDHLFDDLSDWAGTQYRPVMGDRPAPALVWDIDLPRATGILVEEGAAGTTDVAGQAGTSFVTLRLNLARFSYDTIWQIPYILIHELVCHHYQAATRAGARRDNGGDLDGWTEGWMDEIAFELSAAWMRERAPAIGWLGADDSDLARVVEKYHGFKLRLPVGGPLTAEDLEPIMFGKEARRLLRGFSPFDRPGIERQFAFAVNIADLSRTRRYGLVRKLVRGLREPYDPSVIEDCRRFLVDGDVEALLARHQAG